MVPGDRHEWDSVEYVIAFAFARCCVTRSAQAAPECVSVDSCSSTPPTASPGPISHTGAASTSEHIARASSLPVQSRHTVSVTSASQPEHMSQTGPGMPSVRVRLSASQNVSHRSLSAASSVSASARYSLAVRTGHQGRLFLRLLISSGSKSSKMTAL